MSLTWADITVFLLHRSFFFFLLHIELEEVVIYLHIVEIHLCGLVTH